MIAFIQGNFFLFAIGNLDISLLLKDYGTPNAQDQRRVELAATNWDLKCRPLNLDVRFPQHYLHHGRHLAFLRRMASNKGEVSTTKDKQR